MIAIFGGTTEGRVAAEVCDRAAKKYLYATKGSDQRLLANYAEQISGAMDSDEIEAFIGARGVDLIIDAAHPYAEMLHKNIAAAAAKRGVKTIRFERLQNSVEYPNIRWFNSLQEVVTHIQSHLVTKVLSLTGVKSAKSLANIAEQHDITLRIMDREESQQEISRAGFPAERVIYYNLTAEDNFDQTITSGHEYNAIITKESGRSGGFAQKILLAQQLNIPIFVICRPPLPQYCTTVYGEHGLRREIEQILPHYFALRTGFTTGSAATAASVAALRAVLFKERCCSVSIELPNGEPFAIPISKVDMAESYAIATVIKDGGDDVDATDKIEISARAEVTYLNSQSPRIEITGGQGVGRVTLPGIGIDVGEAAINPVPQQMIRSNISPLLGLNSATIQISVPHGAEIAKKTFNPRLGIVGGISILGTSGIVQPFSAEAFIESIERQISIVRALHRDTIVINSGAMSERFIKTRYPDFEPQCYIHYGNMIGATIELAAKCNIKNVILGVMIGKAVKLAAGALDTHSKESSVDRKFLSGLAQQAGCKAKTIAKIAELTTARQLWTIVSNGEHKLFTLIKSCCYSHCKPLIPNGRLEILLVSENGEII